MSRTGRYLSGLGAVLGVLVCAPVAASAQGSIEGTVLDSLRNRAPLTGAMVVLVEQNRYATSDSRGRFRFDSVAPGRVTIGLLHPVLDSLDLQLTPQSVDAMAGRTVKTTVVVPPAERLYSRLCTDTRDADGGVVVGRVRDIDDGTMLAGAVVATEWVEHTLANGVSTPQVMAAVARTDSSGVFVLCNVPTQVPLAVRARLGEVLAGPARLSLDDRLLGRVDLALSRRDTAAQHVLVADSVVSGDEVRGTATLRGRVTRQDGSPAAEAVVGVPGSGRSTRTDAEGRFVLEGIAAGTRTIDIRAVGSAPLMETIDLPTGGVRDTAFVLVPPAQILSTVNTLERYRDRMSYAGSGFFERRRMGLGAFLTEEEIKRHRGMDLNGVLMGVRGVSIEGGAFFGMPYLRGMVEGSCIPTFWVDGARFRVDGARAGLPGKVVQAPFTDLAAMLPVESIKAIEVYASPGGIPIQFDDTALTGCGSIVIWTR